MWGSSRAWKYFYKYLHIISVYVCAMYVLWDCMCLLRNGNAMFVELHVYFKLHNNITYIIYQWHIWNENIIRIKYFRIYLKYIHIIIYNIYSAFLRHTQYTHVKYFRNIDTRVKFVCRLRYNLYIIIRQLKNIIFI